MRTTMRVIDSMRTVLGEWFVAPENATRLQYVLKQYQEMQQEEPNSDLRLQTRGDVADWHDYVNPTAERTE